MAACTRNNIRMLLVNKSDLAVIAEVQALLGSGECLPLGLPEGSFANHGRWIVA